MRSTRPTRSQVAPLSLAALLLPLLVLVPSARAGDWPREFDSPSGTIVVYQPQPEQLHANVLEARAAFSLQRRPGEEPTFGVLWFQAHVAIERDRGTVDEDALDVTRVRLPGASNADARRYEQLVESEATHWDLSGSLAELQSGLAASASARRSDEDLDQTPPKILFATTPTLLLLYDGPPVLEPIEGSRVQRVTNTACAVVFDPRTRSYYLNGANLWYAAPEATGPWRAIEDPPAWVDDVVPPDTTQADQSSGPPPAVITATEPTELVVTDGEPQLEPLVGDQLFYVANTESDVLRDARTNSIWVLLSGRWFSAPSQDGPWTYVAADDLPDVFRDISPDSPRANLLASIAGTEQAEDALADDEIPQTSAVMRTDHDVEVEWDGVPQFETVPGSMLQYGVNTDAEVLFEGGRYFLCDQGVWYASNGPNGPWFVSDSRPAGLEMLRPECPVYNVGFVEIYEATPDVVYVGYLPGYLGYYPCHGTVVYGTGYRYRPWRGHTHYFARPWTWGYHARYNPWLARWSFGYTWSSGFLRCGLRWRPILDEHHVRRPPLWLGPGGFHRQLLAHDRTMVRFKPAPVAPRGNGLTPTNLYARSENRGRMAKVDGRTFRRGVRPSPRPDDVYAGQDGNVYQHADDGWRMNRGRKWDPTPQRPVTPSLPVTGDNGGGSPGGARWREGVQAPTPKPAPQPSPTPDTKFRKPPEQAPPGERPGRQIKQAPLPVDVGALERDFRARMRAIDQQPRVVAPLPHEVPRPVPTPAKNPPAEKKPDRTEKPESPKHDK